MGEEGEVGLQQRDSLILRQRSQWSRSPFNCELRKINKEIVVGDRAEGKGEGKVREGGWHNALCLQNSLKFIRHVDEHRRR